MAILTVAIIKYAQASNFLRWQISFFCFFSQTTSATESSLKSERTVAILEFNATNVKSITTAAGLKVRFLTFPGVLKANYPRKHHLQHLLMKRLLNQLKCLLMGQLPHQLQHLRIKLQHLLKTSRHLKRHLLHSPPRRDGKYKYRVFIITILLIFLFIYFLLNKIACSLGISSS